MSIPQSGGGPIESFDQLAAYMESGCKPKADWRIGTEHEKFGWLTDTRQPLPYAGDALDLARSSRAGDRFGWTPVREGDNIIGLTRNGANVSLEPGGQFELSGAPLTTVNEVRPNLQPSGRSAGNRRPDGHALHGDRRRAGMAARRHAGDAQGPLPADDRLHGPRRHPWHADDVPDLHRAGEPRLRLRSRHGEEAARGAGACSRWRRRFSPRRPFFDGKLNGHEKLAQRIWRNLDASRTGMLPFAFEEGMGFQRYVDWVLDVPMYFVYRDGKYINALGQSFRDFLAGSCRRCRAKSPRFRTGPTI
jgi:glutamate--cysteine ligase